MTTPRTIRQQFQVEFDFPVVFTRGLFRPANLEFLRAVTRLGEKRRHRLIVFIDSAVARLHPKLAGDVAAYVAAHGEHLDLVAPPRVVPGGEAIKNDLMGLSSLLNAMIERRLCRQSCVVAIGGGAVLDAVGFAAALVHRGLRHIRVPTTVLSQNDSGVGVKNAMNYGGVKNLVGTFAPPFAVLNDFDFLLTLPEREWTDGIAEAFKVAIIKDRGFLDWLCAHVAALRARDQDAMAHLVERCAELHLEHIRTNGDPFEYGHARPLDFGHWSAHKLETLSGHRVSHGQAVAIGIVLDAWYAVQNGWLSEGDFELIYQGLGRAGFALWHDLLEKRSGGSLEILRGLQDFQEHLGGELCVTMPRGLGAKFEVNKMNAPLVESAVHKLKERAAVAAGASR